MADTVSDEKQAQLNLELIKACEEGNVDQVKSLIDAGADILYQDEKGKTLLHIACEKGHKSVVECLIRNHLAWNSVDFEGVSAAEYAKKAGHEDIYQDLVEEGVRTEVLLAYLDNREKKPEEKLAASNADYLQRPLKYQDDKLLDSELNAVMMGWEAPIMEKTAKILCPKEGLSVLNVGFGLGLMDEALQKYKPAHHTIVEAHPDVYKHMLELGWDKRPGVRILFGRWQDVLEQMKDRLYDGIYFDTFGEYYDDLHEFNDHVPDMLRDTPEATYSFFNGLGGTNPFFHDVYCRVASIDLRNCGLTTEYITMPMTEQDSEVIWQGVKRRYWSLPTYNLPICRFEL
ncbi:arginine N-methyltransferase 2 [Anaeromyces robustus]|uniref:Arginine N-methyltransferase 2 n=1 Tax=Anaeromyces robustus TaxID=1754192 RepID=A0A1Y1WXN2_9FUNG|nr:arginine N-methyltransferase 2 [Anaeromyces robustus]|eukprot:ORX77884.1 arginine N-methyltransferase 2 [Anaeromyces robustus]